MVRSNIAVKFEKKNKKFSSKLTILLYNFLHI